MDKLRDLLEEMKADDYVRFKYGKRIEAALKTLEGAGGIDAKELEARLNELLTWAKGGAPAGKRPKSAGPKKKAGGSDA